MFGNRELLIGYQLRQEEGEGDNKSDINMFMYRVCNQAKLLSQIISFIWLWVDYKPENAANYPDDDENTKANKKKAAEELKKIFDNPSQKTTDKPRISKLMRLLHTKPSFVPKDPKESPENLDCQKLLDLVFDNYKNKDKLDQIFPIFNLYEVGIYDLFVDYERFHGQISDPTPNDPRKMAFSIPYPPRPILGEATLTEKNLKDWIEDTSRKRYVAENPYIPTTSS